MNATIIFGTKKLGQVTSTSNSSTDKYPNIPVITVEGQKGAKKSRRILMNQLASDLLACPVGETQEIVFASVEMGDEAPKQVLITNASFLPEPVEISYKTSKNKVDYDDSKEKGKAVTSSHACTEILSFLGLSDEGNTEFKLVPFSANGLKAFSLSTTIEEDVIETNNASLTTSDVVNETIAEVKRAEVASPVLQEEVTEVENTTEEFEDALAGSPVLAETVPAVDSDWM